MTDVSKTELALQALASVLTDALLVAGFPELKRNETLDTLLENIGDGSGSIINLIDGNGDVAAETAGADSMADGFEIEHDAEIEFLLVNDDAEQRDAMFDKGLVTIADAVKSSINGAAVHTLGGAVSDARLQPPIERSNPRADGLPNVKYAVVKVKMSFTSDRIF